MSSKSYLNMTPEQRKTLEEARRRREEAAKALREAVEQALREREIRIQEAIRQRLAEMGEEAVAKLKGAGRLETVSDVEASKASRTLKKSLKAARETISACLAYFEELGRESPEAASAVEALVGELSEGMDRGRLDLIYDTVRAALAKEITVGMRTDLLRKEIAGFIEDRPKGAVGDEFVRRANELMAQRRIRFEDVEPVRAEYLRLLEADRAAAEGLDLLVKARRFLSERGYHLLDANGRPVNATFPLARDGVYYFGGANPDYRIRAHVDRHGGLELQHLRVVAAREEAKALSSHYRAELEKTETERWCSAQAELSEILKNDGAKVSYEVLKRSGASPLPVMVDKNKERFGRTVGAVAREAGLKSAARTEGDAGA
ncbi:MAG: hypothetical protein LBR80_15915 [Deltaproteobacteria bacterium]|jgi:hypothetical protein|nr:hypothetical protein [Deltaproteobacteria bacterium]